jgi:hypothetical protein
MYYCRHLGVQRALDLTSVSESRPAMARPWSRGLESWTAVIACVSIMHARGFCGRVPDGFVTGGAATRACCELVCVRLDRCHDGVVILARCLDGWM